LSGTQGNGVFSNEAAHKDQASEDHTSITKTLVWVGIAGLSAALAVMAARAFLNRQPVDPTSQRIQQLIDEANQLLRTLDEQRSSG